MQLVPSALPCRTAGGHGPRLASRFPAEASGLAHTTNILIDVARTMGGCLSSEIDQVPRVPHVLHCQALFRPYRSFIALAGLCQARKTARQRIDCVHSASTPCRITAAGLIVPSRLALLTSPPEAGRASALQHLWRATRGALERKEPAAVAHRARRALRLPPDLRGPPGAGARGI